MLFYPSPERKIKKKMNLSIKTIIYIDLVAAEKTGWSPVLSGISAQSITDFSQLSRSSHRLPFEGKMR
jgi:hypothetical protein